QDYYNGNLIENLNMEYLYDGLWKAARFPLSAKMIDPVSCKITTLQNQINLMIEYANNSLKYFNTSHIIKNIINISKFGTEADDQVDIFKESGFDGLKQYLMNSTQYI
ncbi:uncharacterized protein METZ01_LOCUS443554, partial [marine metagenome]